MNISKTFFFLLLVFFFKKGTLTAASIEKLPCEVVFFRMPCIFKFTIFYFSSINHDTEKPCWNPCPLFRIDTDWSFITIKYLLFLDRLIWEYLFQSLLFLSRYHCLGLVFLPGFRCYNYFSKIFEKVNKKIQTHKLAFIKKYQNPREASRQQVIFLFLLV